MYQLVSIGDAAVWKDFASVSLSADDFTENTIDIQLYPNPVHEQLYIDLSSDLVIEQVKIYNNLGQLIKQEVSSRIDVSNLTSGLYYVVITTNKGKTTKKLLVE